MSPKAKKKDHMVMGGKGLRCLNCGVEMAIPYPCTIRVLKACGLDFKDRHGRCKPSEAGAARFKFTTPDEWIESWDTGTSSMTIFEVMTGRRAHHEDGSVLKPDVPHDPQDFGRCHRLLAAFPEWRKRLPEVAVRLPAWAPLVESWDELTRLYEEELPTGKAPKLYALMETLTRGAATP